jgi:hypothetical protein
MEIQNFSYLKIRIFGVLHSFHSIYTLRTMCNLSLGVWDTHTFCLKEKKKKKKVIIELHVHVIFKTLVDLKIVI